MDVKNKQGVLEAINFQSKSNLGGRLTNLFKEIMVFRDEIEKKYDLKSYEKRLYFFDKLEAYAEKRISEDLQNIVLEETGINIRKIAIIPIEKSCGIIGISLAMKNKEMIHVYGQVLAGYDIRELRRNRLLSDYVDEMIDYSENLNLKNGYFDFKSIKSKINCNLYIDMGTAFIMDMVNLGIKKEDRLTPEELSSIIIHEIGHIITSIEYVAYQQYLGIHGTQFITEKKKEINNPKEYIKELELIKILDKIEKSVAQKQKGNISKFKKIIFKITSTTISKIFFSTILILIQIDILITIISNFIGIIIINKIISMISFFDKKSFISEYQTKRNDFVIERLADEYVSRHGYGGYLANGLRKLFDCSSDMEINNPFNVFMMKNIPLIRLILISSDTIKKGFLKNIFDFNNRNYEKDNERLMRLYQNNMAIFKNPNLPAVIRNDYIRDTELTIQALKDLNKLSKRVPKMVSSTIGFVIDLLNTPDKFIKILSGDISNEQFKLLEDLDKLMNNEFYYYSAKFK